jgi:sterol desaturase/sphingolipid hydroxylase (fatty acid hydroxylase superfamily)
VWCDHPFRHLYPRSGFSIAISILPVCPSDGVCALIFSLTLLGLCHRNVRMFDVETKSHSGVTLQTPC